MSVRSILVITALFSAAPLMAQDNAAAARQAADAREAPQTRALNNQVNSAVTQTETANAVARAQSDIDQAQYEADKAAYERAMRAHRRDDATFARQQRAYALAMHAWRNQVALCKQGHRRVCDMPPPDPMDYM
jgi:hypothetical protein